jgi:hypothetical protein
MALALAALASLGPPAPAEPADPVPDELEEHAPRLLFYLALEGDTVGATPLYRIRSVSRNPWFENILVEPHYDNGLLGRAALCYGDALSYPAEDVLRSNNGTLFLWFKWDKVAHATGKFPNPLIVNGELSIDAPTFLKGGDGEWHHWAFTWDIAQNSRAVYLDGARVHQGPWNGFSPGVLTLGAGCPGWLDEVCILDAPMDEETITLAMDRGRKGQCSFPEALTLQPASFRYPAAIQVAEKKRPDLPAAVDWTLRPNLKNAARTRYDLSGHWRIQLTGIRMAPPKLPEDEPKEDERADVLFPTDGPWALALCPGNWRADRSLFTHDSLQPLEQWNGLHPSMVPAAWLERDFTLPQDAPTGSVFLMVSGVYNESDIYLNDRFLGQVLAWQQREVDVTEIVKRGANNRISILSGKPFQAVRIKDRSGKPAATPAGICLPVQLECRRGRVTFLDATPLPSVREKRLDVEVWPSGPRGTQKHLSAECAIRDMKTGQTFRLGPVPVPPAGGPAEPCLLSFPWQDPILWSPEEPRLLEMSLIVSDADQTVDQTFPVKFGFREVWVDGGTLKMNGIPFTLRGNCHNFTGDVFRGERKLLEQHIRMLREEGLGAGIAYPEDFPQVAEALEIADETGFLVVFHFWPAGDSPEGRAWIRSRLRWFRNHPSVILYALGQGYQLGPYGHPISLGRRVEDQEKELPEYKASAAAVDLMQRIDPSRPVTFYMEGAGGDLRSIMHYFTWGTPLQTKEEWFRYWAKTKPCPYLAIETNMGYYKDFWLWQRPSNPGGIEPCVTEHAARIFGNAAYTRETAEFVRLSDKARTKPKASEPTTEVNLSPNFALLNAFTWEHCLRSWRTYGASYCLHSVASWGWTIPGWDASPGQALNPLGRALADAGAPFLATIAGSTEDFVRKDHAFFAGEQVEKQIVLVNGTLHPVTAKAQWKAVDADGATFHAGQQVFQSEPGTTLAHPFAFSAPAVSGKRQCRIELFVEADGRSAVDRFSFEVFPRAPTPAAHGARLALVDTHGDTAALLKKAGIDFKQLNLPRGSGPQDWDASLDGFQLLIIGRKSLPTDAGTVHTLLRRVTQGLNILCFEQTAREVFGLRNDDPNTRHAFVTAPDHPLVSGLSDEDFRDWRGASDILDPYPDYRNAASYGLLDMHSAKGFFGENEFTHWSANGTVAAFHFEKPQIGRFRAILSSGFDMLYTPLVELLLGKGRLLLCSLDVTNRYGMDPVATLLCNRLLAHAAKPAETGQPLAYWGCPEWCSVLKELRVDCTSVETPGDLVNARVAMIGLPMPAAQNRSTTSPPDMAVPGLGGDGKDEGGDADAEDLGLDGAEKQAAEEKPLPPGLARQVRVLSACREALRSFVEQGGVLIISPLPSIACAEPLPVQPKMETREVFKADPADVAELSGTTAADFYFRTVQEVPVLVGLPAGSRLQEAGLVGVTPVGKGKVVFCQISPSGFADPWQRTKALRVWAALLANVGAQFRTELPAGEPEDWSKLWYAAAALDFNPDLHREW